MDPEIIRFITFSVIAVIRTALDVLIWQLLVFFFQEDSIFVKIAKVFRINRFAAAQAIAFIISVLVSYFANKEITYRDRETTNYSIIVFTIISIISFFASIWVINLLTSNRRALEFSRRHPLLEKFWPLTAKLLTIFITVVINYTGYTLFVFN
jgi:putative flippase GtrA